MRHSIPFAADVPIELKEASPSSVRSTPEWRWPIALGHARRRNTSARARAAAPGSDVAGPRTAELIWAKVDPQPVSWEHYLVWHWLRAPSPTWAAAVGLNCADHWAAKWSLAFGNAMEAGGGDGGDGGVGGEVGFGIGGWLTDWRTARWCCWPLINETC